MFDPRYSGTSLNLPTRNVLIQNQRCRICLQQQGDLISLPCLCKEDLGKVHLKCYSKWVQTISPLNISSTITSTKCQICKKNIKLRIKVETKNKNCKQIHQNHRYCEIISGILGISVIIFLIYLCIQAIIDNVGNSFIMYLVFSAVIIFLFVMLKVVLQLLLRIFQKREIVFLEFLTLDQESQNIKK